MIRFLMSAILCLVVVFGSFAASVDVATDRVDALYSLTDNAKFVVTADVSTDCTYTLSLDGTDVFKSGKIKASPEPVSIQGKLGKPGFLRCTLSYSDSETGKKSYSVATAGFEPEKIKPAFAKLPEDFGSFWNQRKSQLSCIPINAIMEPVVSRTDNVEIFDIKLDCIGRQVSGYYAKPVDASKGSSPAILFMQGAGVYSARTGSVSEYAAMGFIALEINAHGLPNGESKEFYSELNSGKLFNYKHWGKQSPYTSYFTGMFTRVVRALEFLKAQPQWDGKILVAFGSSQGGAQALAAAGLDQDVNIVAAAVPAMCDHSGKINGWPKMIPHDADGSYNKQISDASRYVDTVNFVRNTKAYGIFTVGFVDTVCRPTSVYATYNTFPNAKEITNEPMMNHAFPQEHREIFRERILAVMKDKLQP